LTAGAQEVNPIDLELMRVCNQVDRLNLFVLKLREQTRIEWLLGHKRITEVSFTRHKVDVDGLTNLIDELLQAFKGLVNI
jgi:hypothetical protein